MPADRLSLYVWPERELDASPLYQGKGLDRLWDMVLTGQDGDETRKLLLLVNHSLLDGESILIWMGQIFKNLNDPEAMQVSMMCLQSLSTRGIGFLP
jgi:hypothetical protein